MLVRLNVLFKTLIYKGKWQNKISLFMQKLGPKLLKNIFADVFKSTS